MEFDFSEEIELKTQRLLLKTLGPGSPRLLLDYHLRNREHFRSVFPKLAQRFFTENYQQSRLRQEQLLKKAGQAIRFYFFEPDEPGYIAGDISISNMLYGSSMSCKMGYKLDHTFTGRGFMSEALKEVILFIFNGLQLHRIEVNIMPDNYPSIKLAKKMGFTQEGIAYQYLNIDGRWEDHLRFSLINPTID